MTLLILLTQDSNMTRFTVLFAFSIALSFLFGGTAALAWCKGDVDVAFIATLIALPQIFAAAGLYRHCCLHPLSEASQRDIVKAVVSSVLLWTAGLVIVALRNHVPSRPYYAAALNALFGMAAFTSLRDTLSVLLMPSAQSRKKIFAAIKQLARPLPDWDVATDSDHRS